MKKYIVILVIILLLVGTALGWFLFAWNGGLVGGAIIHWLRSAASFLREKFIFISPFGRVKELSDKLKYAMIWATVLCALGFLFSLFILFEGGSQGFLKNLVFLEMAIAEFFVSWYIMYPICLLVIKINVLFKFLSAVALIISFIIVEFILIAQMVVLVDI